MGWEMQEDRNFRGAALDQPVLEGLLELLEPYARAEIGVVRIPVPANVDLKVAIRRSLSVVWLESGRRVLGRTTAWVRRYLESV